MSDVAIVLAVGIAAWLLIAHTKRALILLASIVALAGAAGAYLFLPSYLEQKQRAAKTAAVSVTITTNQGGCSDPFPLMVTVTNRSKSVVNKVSFDIVGNEIGRSDTLYDSGYLGISSDQIVQPLDGYSLCYGVPARVYNMPEWRYADLKPDSVNWKIENVSVTFADN